MNVYTHFTGQAAEMVSNLQGVTQGVTQSVGGTAGISQAVGLHGVPST